MVLSYIGILSCILCLATSKLYAQTIGNPEILNFPQKLTSAGAQTWQIDQDSAGNMYFANNSGLLTYNGREWKLFKLPNKTIVRSILLTSNGRVYAGGQDAFGYFFPDATGRLTYHSLLHLIDTKHRSFGDVWNMVQFGAEIFFRTSFKIYKYSPTNNKITVYEAPPQMKWGFMGVSNHMLMAQNGGQNTVYFHNNQWQEISLEPLRNTLITGFHNFGRDTSLITTLRGGLFLLHKSKLWPLPVSKEIINSQVYVSTQINTGAYALGTVSNGIYFINKQGNTSLHYSVDNGMQNNNVLSLYLDSHAHLWAGMDEGIDLINHVSPITKISPLKRGFPPTYTAHVFGRELYLGTSDGLYVSDLTLPSSEDLSLSTGGFRKVENSNRQVWSLFDNGKQLLMGHHDGAYVVTANGARLIDNYYGGYWLYRQLPGSMNLVSGTYEGLELFEAKGDAIQPTKRFERALNETLRFIEVDSLHYIVWGAHPYRGIYKMTMDPTYDSIVEVQLLNNQQGLPANTNNFVFKVNGQVIFTTEKGIYAYDHTKGVFKKSEPYTAIFGDQSVKFITNDKKGRIWFATEEGMGVVENGIMKNIPELDGELIAGFENIYPFNDNNIFIGSNKGIIHLNYNLYHKQYSSISVLLNKVAASSGKQDSVIYNGYFVENGVIKSTQSMSAIPELASDYTSLRFDFSSNQFGRPNKITYSFKLQGFDREWSAWSVKSEKDYTNLPHGKYTFMVKAKDNLNNTSPVSMYTFIIRPRWYQTTTAFIAYTLLLTGLVLLLNRLHNARLEKQKKLYEQQQAHLKYVHELEMEHTEKEIIQLRNEKLETEVLYKNKELATTTMHLYKRGRLLGRLKEDLTEGLNKLKDPGDKTAFKQVIKLLAEEEKRDQDWEQFAIHFDQVHNDFLQKIKKAYPDLSPGDLKICAYLKMNLSSKEIAQLLNISLKGVEIGRYRLRKKLGLAKDVNLTNFISGDI